MQKKWFNSALNEDSPLFYIGLYLLTLNSSDSRFGSRKSILILAEFFLFRFDNCGGSLCYEACVREFAFKTGDLLRESLFSLIHPKDRSVILGARAFIYLYLFNPALEFPSPQTHFPQYRSHFREFQFL